jgi:hypothetical protein
MLKPVSPVAAPLRDFPGTANRETQAVMRTLLAQSIHIEKPYSFIYLTQAFLCSFTETIMRKAKINHVYNTILKNQIIGLF